LRKISSEEFNFGSDWTLFSSFKTCKSLNLNPNKRSNVKLETRFEIGLRCTGE